MNFFERYLILLVSVFLGASCSREAVLPEAGSGRPEVSSASDVAAVPGVAIIRLGDEMVDLIERDLDAGKVVTRSRGLNRALDELGIATITRLFPHAGEYEGRTRRVGLHKWYVVEYDKRTPFTRAETELSSVPGIEHVECRRPIRTAVFNDPKFEDQWDLYNRGTDGGKEGADINVSPVWRNYGTGRPAVVVSVVDGGIDLDHEDLAWNSIGDVAHGGSSYNFVDNSNVVYGTRHGTHVAGTIAAAGNNGKGIAGIAGGDYELGNPGVRLLSCQIFKTAVVDGKSVEMSGSSANAIKWGADHGAVICTNSWGYDYDKNNDGKLAGDELAEALAATVSASDKAAIDYFIQFAGCDDRGEQRKDSPMRGGVVIFAAGNDGIQNGAPANYAPVIAVGSITKAGLKADYSNYGDWVDLCAPGTSIMSTLPDDQYGLMTGTSMACPHVTGVAALTLSCLGGPGFTADMLKEKLLKGAKQSFISPSAKIGPLVDALGAISYGNASSPDAVSDYSVETDSNRASFRWKHTADKNGNPAYGYMLLASKDRAALEQVDLSRPGSGIFHRIVPAGEASPGDDLSGSIPDLAFDTDYYVTVVGYSYFRLFSPLAPLKTVRTKSNNPPEIAMDYPEPRTFKAFESFRIPFTVQEPDGHDFTVQYIEGSPADKLVQGPEGTLFADLTCRLADAGTYTARIVATDTYGLSVTRAFTYTILENRPPVKERDFENMLITKPGESFELDMPAYFSDDDGEPLQYQAEISDQNVVFLSPKDNVLIGTTLKYGLATVTIRASDARNAVAEATFSVLVRDPSIRVVAYPNPVADVLRIGTGEKEESTFVKVVSQTGAVIFEDSVQASAFNPAQVDLSGCAPGRYHLTVRFGTTDHRQTIVKQ